MQVALLVCLKCLVACSLSHLEPVGAKGKHIKNQPKLLHTFRGHQQLLGQFNEKKVLLVKNTNIHLAHMKALYITPTGQGITLQVL